MFPRLIKKKKKKKKQSWPALPSLPSLSFSSLGPLFPLPFLLSILKIAPSALMSERELHCLEPARSTPSGLELSILSSRKPFLLPPNTLVAFPSPLKFPRDPATLFTKPKWGLLGQIWVCRAGGVCAEKPNYSPRLESRICWALWPQIPGIRTLTGP